MLTQKDLKSRIHYNPETGVFTHIKSSQGVKAGSRAGCFSGRGYRRLGINSQAYAEHRLAFLYMTGQFPQNQVDHINRDRADNHWENLRDVTPGQNAMNGYKGPPKKNGLPRGVHKDGRKYAATIGVNNKRIYLGSFPSAITARMAYDKAVAKYYGKEFVGKGLTTKAKGY